MALAAFVAIDALNAPVVAQDFSWPWETKPRPRPPVPREPVYRAPDDPGAPQGRQPGRQLDNGSPWGVTETYRAPNNICLELERRLVQETRGETSARQQLPAIREEMRKVSRSLAKNQTALEKGKCYEYFLFSKQLRNTRNCINLSKTVDNARRRLAELESQSNRVSTSTGRSRQSEIIRELARNRCGDAYVKEARRRDFNPFSSLWQDDDSGGGTYGNRYNQLPFATYRTLCVRLCDGYYFPVSFSTLPNHFGRDAQACQSKCVAPTELYFHQNPGAGVDDMVAFSTNTRYTELKTAFRYRKEYVKGCSCKQAEYLPQTPAPSVVPSRQQGAVEQPSSTAQARRALSPTR